MSVFAADGRSYDSAGRWRTSTYAHSSEAGSSGDTLYIKGDEFTDGSIRFQFTEGEDNAHVERRADGVWNDTGFRFASSSIQLGFNTTLSAVASFIEIVDLSSTVGHTISFLPHTDIGDDGATEFTFAPRMKVSETFVVFSDAVSETTATTIGINLGVTPSRAVVSSIHEVGTTGATDEVVVKFFKGTDNTGTLFDKKTLPPADLVANTTLTIDYDQDLGFEGGQDIFQEFTSDTAFSLKTDSSGNPLTSHFAHQLEHLAIITENLIYDNSNNHVLTESLDPVYGNQF